jgi:hypothetical protein
MDFETHHIIPRSLQGQNSPDNLVKLSYREHFIAHLLLTKMCFEKEHEIKMCWALHRLSHSRKKSNRSYNLARKIHRTNVTQNHPSRHNAKWGEKVSLSNKKSWANNNVRRIATAEKRRQIFERDKPQVLQHLKSISKKGAEAAKQKIAIRIEYKGKIYCGWSELKQQTGVSKHLYKKYYLEGIDPEYRIGANGPEQRRGLI